ncbi:hypothetical protein [Streptomyces xanthophaeus]|uniref:hypothetical protein n=1 Tax=Streptomyces xanthophaeus TaxID=67385 RepID=UPI0026471471|nr:hypothetical protein [Streptomyces xanthophaeus]WKD36505.1 hypothetical protein KO717_34290 [Streptomyces xanthophaeus]
MPLITDVGITVSATNTKVTDFTTSTDPLIRRYAAHLESGSGAGKADRIFADQRTLAASANETLDLAGSLTDNLGVTTSFARVKFILVAAVSTNVNNVVIGANASADFVGLLNAAGTVTLRPGAWFASASGSTDATGMVVTATTADLIKIANSGAGTSVVYDIIIIGNST